MKLTLLTFLSLFFTIQISAQTTFFVAPLVNMKVDFCNYGGMVRWGLFNSELQHTQHQNPYYTFHANRVSFQPDINIGIRVGASFKSKKHLVMFEWAQDAARIASKVNSFQTPNTFGAVVQDEGVKNYIHGTGYFSAGFVYDRFSFSYALRMTKEQFPSKFYFLSDLSILKNYQNR